MESGIKQKLMKIKHSLLKTVHHEIFIVVLQTGYSVWKGVNHFVAELQLDVC